MPASTKRPNGTVALSRPASRPPERGPKPGARKGARLPGTGSGMRRCREAAFAAFDPRGLSHDSPAQFFCNHLISGKKIPRKPHPGNPVNPVRKTLRGSFSVGRFLSFSWRGGDGVPAKLCFAGLRRTSESVSPREISFVFLAFFATHVLPVSGREWLARKSGPLAGPAFRQARREFSSGATRTG